MRSTTDAGKVGTPILAFARKTLDTNSGSHHNLAMLTTRILGLLVGAGVVLSSFTLRGDAFSVDYLSNTYDVYLPLEYTGDFSIYLPTSNGASSCALGASLSRYDGQLPGLFRFVSAGNAWNEYTRASNNCFLQIAFHYTAPSTRSLPDFTLHIDSGPLPTAYFGYSYSGIETAVPEPATWVPAAASLLIPFFYSEQSRRRRSKRKPDNELNPPRRF